MAGGLLNGIPSRIVDAFRFFFELGEDPGPTSLSTEIFPTVELLNQFEIFIQQMGGALGTGQFFRAADAANFSQGQIFNPVNSNMLVVVYRARNEGVNPLTIFSSTAPATVDTASAFHRDMRRDTAGQRPVAQLRAGVLGTRVTNLLWGPINQNEEHNGVYVLPPGRGLNYFPAAINLVSDGFLHWLEIPGTPEMLMIR